MTSHADLDRRAVELLSEAREQLGPRPEQRRDLRNAVFASVGMLGSALSGPAAAGQVTPIASSGVPPRPSGVRSKPEVALTAAEQVGSVEMLSAGSVAGARAGARFGAKAVAGGTIGGLLVGFAVGYLTFAGARLEAVPMRAAVVEEAPSVVEAVPVLELEQLEPRAPETPRLEPSPVRTNVRRSNPAPESAALPPPMSFYEELTYLRRAQAALRRKEPALALGLMQSLDELSSAGALLSERAMTKVLSLCLLEREEEALEVARGLTSSDGAALYRERLGSSCARAAVSEVFEAPATNAVD